MSADIQITVLVENTTRQPGLIAEHGLAFWIDTGPSRVLFDTGQGRALSHNASVLQVDLRTVDAVVLSHGHYDHTGGLRQVLDRAPRVKVFLHPNAPCPRFSRSGERVRPIGLNSIGPADLQNEGVTWTTGPTEVVPGVFVTGAIPRVTEFEDTGGHFYLDQACQEADPIADDQALYFESDAGTVILLGCAHAGIINTVQHVRSLTANRPIQAILGGTHLLNASAHRMAQTIDALRGLNLRLLAPGHCTGPGSVAALWTAFPVQIADCSTGARFEFSRPSRGLSAQPLKGRR